MTSPVTPYTEEELIEVLTDEYPNWREYYDNVYEAIEELMPETHFNPPDDDYKELDFS